MNSIYPPYLDQVHQHCPQASLVYTQCWRDKDENLKVFYEKNKITEDYLISWKTFKNSLKYLKKEKVLTFSIDSKNRATIILSCPQHNQKALCA